MRLSQSALEKEYIPALEGMRSLAVLAVLFFHLEINFFPGGSVYLSYTFRLKGFGVCHWTVNYHVVIPN